jgi:ketosteroid isomerase-like protein
MDTLWAPGSKSGNYARRVCCEWACVIRSRNKYPSLTEHDVIAKGGMVLAVGEAGGTIDGVTWRTPAAWKAVIRDGRVAEWRVFADNKPVYEILARRQQ